MKVNPINYSRRNNFGSAKLANLTLRKVLPNMQTISIPAEMHRLDGSDLPLVTNLFERSSINSPKFMDNIYYGFRSVYESGVVRPENKIFLMVRQNAAVAAICEATLDNKENQLYLDYITNTNRKNGVRGAGTSLIVNLVELAKNAGKKTVALNADREAVPFYKKLGFVMVDKDLNFEMQDTYFDTFIKKFKPKYFRK